MPMFSYTAKDNTGKTKTGMIESLNEQVLVDKLQKDGLFVLDVRLAVQKVSSKGEKKERETRFDHDNVKLEDLLVFSRQMATMLEAGVTMLRSLNIIISQIQSRRLYLAAKDVHDDIEHGASLSVALNKHPQIFNQFWVSLSEVGEASGTMPRVLNKLADHVEKDAAFRSAIVSAMVYPAILCVVCIGAIIFFALVVGPRFQAIFESMHVQLPLLTRCLLNTFDFIKQYFFFLVGGVVGIVFIIRYYISTPFGRLNYENFLFSLPVVGEITKLIVVERFTGQMAILIESGVPLLYSLEISEKMVDNKNCALVIAQVRERVREGTGMADALMEESFFPIMCVQMIKVGEETGDLGKMLHHVADFYQSNVEAFMKRISSLIEPFILVFMAGIIGTIVVAIFMPLFKLGQGAGH
ncbi:MAG: type II secretion system F family protein [Candidatus Omnitrophica bacterium]|nr:type II secretion system F family protein [Candidatus Omnitrophota bacterium]